MLISEKIQYGTRILLTFSPKNSFGAFFALKVRPERKKKVSGKNAAGG